MCIRIVLTWLCIVDVSFLRNSLSTQANTAGGCLIHDRGRINQQTRVKLDNFALSMSSTIIHRILVYDAKLAGLVKSRLSPTLFRNAISTWHLGLRGGELEVAENRALCFMEIAGDSTTNIVGEALKSNRTPMYGHSRSGETVLVEVVSASDDDEKGNGNILVETKFNTTGTNETFDRQVVRSELQNIAKEFPSCAKYLLKELDKRRLVSVDNII
jgi:hypothetical protein